ncbi:hypothetical protein IQ249_03290 [Lusitaniella coriacea LEGE 07157]|uniref:Cobalamin biosynthesis protein CobQ n=1 Tax=Lusitaniella coriacea LEGE 07157 TaxID=945747 RepID=A0A8J7B0H9_9CYAN|nr:hypothetical protein [Lusitaniella coriacea]MBE9114915.1 hypothetical protein [Lusitaniella coriacea LEGE 07157]
MNTPAHAVLNLLLLGRKSRPENHFPILLGAILPDLPMFAFYFWEKVVRRIPESVIWSHSYYDPSWQGFFDLFNSLPLAIIGMVICYYYGASRWLALLASMALHALEDLPLHGDDAHRHFFPLSNWRFESPISYWDPNRYGTIVSLLEAIAVLGICFILLRRHTSLKARTGIALIVAIYIAYGGYALLVWG